jgi:hypothetical protein
MLTKNEISLIKKKKKKNEEIYRYWFNQAFEQYVLSLKKN